MDAQEQINKFQEFLEEHYYEDILRAVSKGAESVLMEFSELTKFDIRLAEELLEKPEDSLKAIEYAISRFDLGEGVIIRPRFRELPLSSQLLISEIRSKNIDKLYQFKGIVRQKTDVRPQVTSAKFECPSCGNIISILQIDTKFKEPSSCSCGRKGKFNMVSKELVDAQKIVLEEAPEDLDGGEQPKRMNIFLKQDLVSPLSDKKTNPGSKIIIVGTLKEIPIVLATGGKSTRFDLIIEANHVEPMQEEFSSLELSDEQKEEILEMSRDPKIYEKLTQSIAPTIYGHDRIKEALVLQLFGGCRKSQKDGVKRRGDIHILLVGDPGSGKSQLLKRLSIVAPKSRFVSGKGASGAGLCVSPKSTILSNPGGMDTAEKVIEQNFSKPEEYREGIWKENYQGTLKIQSFNKDLKLQTQKPAILWKLKAPNKVYKVTLQSGKSVELTGNTQLFCLENGKPTWKKSKNIEEGDFVATPRKLVGGETTKKEIIDLISSNPVIHNIKSHVKKIIKNLSKEQGTTRDLAKKLGIRENQLYHHWVCETARGNIKLKDLKKLAELAKIEYKSKIKEVSLYNGKKHALPRFVNKDLLYVAGLLAGDGDLRANNKTISIRLSGKTKELHKIFREVLTKQFNLKYNITKGTEQRPEATRTNSKILGEILFSLGLIISPKSANIQMSNELLHFSNKLLSNYLAGLFDADGSINKRNTKGSNTIDLTTCSEQLAKQTQLVLLRYDIHSQIRRREASTNEKVKGKHPKWVLEIRGINNIKNFIKNIPLRHPEKKQKLKSLISNIESNTNTDIIPGAGLILKKELQKNKVSLKKIRWQENISRQALQRIIKEAKIKNKELETLANSDIYWEKVKTIQTHKPDYEYVYDFTVEKSHNFVVDGVLVHNTASVVKDEFLRGWALEAGALVLANKGLVCIDELDKMTKEDTSAMHEALEQQTVTISKANIQATLRSETTVLAAANPKMGRFDPYEILAKQIDLPSTLINRFDLIFPVKDLPDETKDEKLAHFILNLHKGIKGDDTQALETDTIKRYVAYSKQFINPVLTDAALNEIKRYFVKMRNSGTTEGKIQSIPISARQLEGMVRLAEASARVRLSNSVTKKDAMIAIDLLHYCLQLIGTDKSGKFDIDRIATGISASQRNSLVVIKQIIANLEKVLNAKEVPIADIMREAEIQEIPQEKTSEVIDKLKRGGDLFSPKHGFISRI
jgi:replicative DNA helicase Mcm